jgi:hypothetical protein
MGIPDFQKLYKWEDTDNHSPLSLTELMSYKCFTHGSKIPTLT